jgi:hypothetical protein
MDATTYSRRVCRCCGRPLTGQRADALYCGAVCRLRAHRGVSPREDAPQAVPPGSTRCTATVKRLAPHFPRPRADENTGGSVAHIAAPSAVITSELGGAWRPVTSPDGVPCEVRQLRPRALIDKRAAS